MNISHVFYETDEDAGHIYNGVADKAIGAALVVFMLFGLLGNLAAVLYFWSRRRENFPDYLYAVNSLVDSLISLLALPVTCSLFNDRHALFFSSYAFCSAFALLFTFLQRYSMFVVMVISVTRTVAISAPFHTVREPLVKVALIVYAVMLAVTHTALLATNKIFTIYFNKLVYCTPLSLMVDWEWSLYMVVHLTTTLLVPVTVFFSLIISCKSLMKKGVLGSEDDKLFWRISVTIALFTAVFLVCNVPMFALYVIESLEIWVEVSPSSFLPSSFVHWYDWLLAGIFLTVLNASINPLLYFLRMSGFRVWIFRCVRHTCVLLGITSAECATPDVSASEHYSRHVVRRGTQDRIL